MKMRILQMIKTKEKRRIVRILQKTETIIRFETL